MYSCKWGISARATFSSAQAQGTRVIVFFECVLFIKLFGVRWFSFSRSYHTCKWRCSVWILSFCVILSLALPPPCPSPSSTTKITWNENHRRLVVPLRDFDKGLEPLRAFVFVDALLFCGARLLLLLPRPEAASRYSLLDAPYFKRISFRSVAEGDAFKVLFFFFDFSGATFVYTHDKYTTATRKIIGKMKCTGGSVGIRYVCVWGNPMCSMFKKVRGYTHNFFFFNHYSTHY